METAASVLSAFLAMSALAWILFGHIFNAHESAVSFQDEWRFEGFAGRQRHTERSVTTRRRRQVYPISGSWFRDRFSHDAWDSVLRDFQAIGGDTVLLRAPPLVTRTKSDILQDPEFAWCTRADRHSKAADCVTEVELLLSEAGIRVREFATFAYEEDFGRAILTCPKFDAVINSSRVYHRLVLPLNSIHRTKPCDFPYGSEVLVLFTVFSGTDPHQLLVYTASTLGMKVYFGLPAAPLASAAGETLQTHLLPAYYDFIGRVLGDHAIRYAASVTLKGYYSTDERCLAELTPDYLDLYQNLGTLVHQHNKTLALSPYIILNRSQANYSADQHVQGFEKLARTRAVDIVAVQEGRGCAKGCYFWPSQEDHPIRQVDPKLDDIVHYLDPNVKEDVSFEEQFTSSNNQLFEQFATKADELRTAGVDFEFWLNVEGFEFLRSDPCLPVDLKGSGMAELLQRTSKSRVDWALTVSGAAAQKIISFAYDSDFTCKSRDHPTSLADEIRADISRPIVSKCRWFSSKTRTIELYGYNLQRRELSYRIQYTNLESHLTTETLQPRTIDPEYGTRHHRVALLTSVLLEPLSAPLGLRGHGIVNITADGAHHSCLLQYH